MLWIQYRNSAISISSWGDEVAKKKWILKSTDFGMGLECENCEHKISLKDYAMADREIYICPFCGSEMDLDSIDEDEIQELLEGEFNND